MKKHSIHQSPAERLAYSSDRTVAAIQENSQIVESLANYIKTKPADTAGFVAMLKAELEGHKKLEEIKSAVLASTIAVKKIPATSLEETNRLLSRLIEKEGQPVKVSIKIV